MTCICFDWHPKIKSETIVWVDLRSQFNFNVLTGFEFDSNNCSNFCLIIVLRHFQILRQPRLCTFGCELFRFFTWKENGQASKIREYANMRIVKWRVCWDIISMPFITQCQLPKAHQMIQPRHGSMDSHISKTKGFEKLFISWLIINRVKRKRNYTLY